MTYQIMQNYDNYQKLAYTLTKESTQDLYNNITTNFKPLLSIFLLFPILRFIFSIGAILCLVTFAKPAKKSVTKHTKTPERPISEDKSTTSTAIPAEGLAENAFSGSTKNLGFFGENRLSKPKKSTNEIPSSSGKNSSAGMPATSTVSKTTTLAFLPDCVPHRSS